MIAILGHMQYDQLLASWIARAPCEDALDGAPIQLPNFRRLERLPGANVPACYLLEYKCPACQQVHQALSTQDVLDWDPLQGLWPVYHDLMLGREMWAPAHSAWLDRLLRGTWPLQGWCSHRRRITGLWPTSIRTLAAREGHDVFDMCFDCPVCESMEFETVPASRLAYGAV